MDPRGRIDVGPRSVILPRVIRRDTNCDRVVSVADIEPFVGRLGGDATGVKPRRLGIAEPRRLLQNVG